MAANGYDPDQIRQQHSLVDTAQHYGVNLVRNGQEWQALCPLHAEETPSFTIYTGNDKQDHFHCFGCGAGGDVIDFVEAMAGVDFRGACETLAGKTNGKAPSPPPPKIAPSTELTPLIPPVGHKPFKAGEKTPPILNPKRSKSTFYTPEAVYPYTDRTGRTVAYVLRVVIGGKKLTPSILWTRDKAGNHAWAHGAMPVRPLYRLHDLVQHPGGQVILTEGEKCADRAAELLPGLLSVTWSGGAQAWKRTDWTSLFNRSVILWPDNDAEGRACMLGSWREHNGRLEWSPGIAEMLLAHGCTLKALPAPHNRPEGWDIADDAWTTESVSKYLKAALEPWHARRIEDYREQTRPKAEPAGAGKANGHDPDPLPQSADPEAWRADLEKDSHDKAKRSSPHNYHVMILHHPTLEGMFAYNRFSNGIDVLKRPPWEQGRFKPRPIADVDFPALRAHLERVCEVMPARGDVPPAVLTAAMQRSYNPLQNYFDRLTWDNCPRVQGGLSPDGDTILPWLTEYMGAADTPINRAYGMRWLISAIARAYHPGCKADCMLILESPQNYGKSTAFRALAKIDGVSYFTDSLRDFTAKDSMLLLQGKLIVEIAELSALKKTDDVAAVKKWLSTQEDQYRRPYGTVTEIFPRSCVFAGTVNPAGSGYLHDPSGERRFWPVAVGRIDVDGIIRDRDHLWAEAVHLYRQHEQHWLTDQEEAWSVDVTRDRQQTEVWAAKINGYLAGKREVYLHHILAGPLDVLPERWSAAFHRRLADYLFRHGWHPGKDETGEEVFTRRIN